MGVPAVELSGGVAANVGTSARWLLLGMAARVGCAAALSAAAGFNADRNLLDGQWPYRSHGIWFSAAALSGFLRDQPAVQGTSIKPYCAAKHGIAAIYGFSQLLERGIPLQSITKVRVGMPALHAGMVGHNDFGASRLARITSCSYNLALAAFNPDELLNLERAEPVDNTAIADFASIVEVVADERLQAQIPTSIPPRSNSLLATSSSRPGRFPMLGAIRKCHSTLSTTKAKFRRILRGIVSEETAQSVEALCMNSLERPKARRELSLVLAGIDEDQTSRSRVAQNRSCAQGPILAPGNTEQNKGRS